MTTSRIVDAMDEDTPLSEADARTLRFLKTLVTVLTATMIVGLITIVGLLVIRINQTAPTVPALPDAIELPAGTRAGALTFGDGWVAVVTEDQRVLVYDSRDGTLLQEIEISTP